MAKTKYWLSLLAVSVVLIAGSLAVSPIAIADDDDDDDDDNELSSLLCPAENVQHWATYSWEASRTITHPTLPSIGAGILEIQVPSDENYSGKGVVVAKLTELGYLTSTSGPLGPSDISRAVPTGNSSTICAE